MLPFEHKHNQCSVKRRNLAIPMHSVELMRKLRSPFKPCSEASGCQSCNWHCSSHHGSFPPSYPARPFPCFCHSFHCASMIVSAAEQWLRPGNWSNWKLNYFFFLAVLLLPLSILFHCVTTRKLIPTDGKAQQKKETSMTALDVLDCISWKWHCRGMEVRTPLSYKTILLCDARHVVASLSSQF